MACVIKSAIPQAACNDDDISGRTEPRMETYLTSADEEKGVGAECFTRYSQGTEQTGENDSGRS